MGDGVLMLMHEEVEYLGGVLTQVFPKGIVILSFLELCGRSDYQDRTILLAAAECYLMDESRQLFQQSLRRKSKNVLRWIFR
jgi:hypothetical protein